MWKQFQFWSGRLKLIQNDNHLFLILEDPVQLTEFARTEVTDPSVVQSTLDSSRYYAVRLERNGKHAWIGLGFDERTDAFDFQASLQDFRKDSNRDKEIELMKKSSENREDLSLKDGETIEVNFSVKSKGSTKTRPSQSGEAPKFSFGSSFKSSNDGSGDKRRIRANQNSQQ